MAMAALMLVAATAYASGTGHARTTPVVAHAASGPTYSLSFSPNHPSSSSAFTFTLNSAQQPTSIQMPLPAGTVFNPASVPYCTTPPNCDPATQVGTGSATVDYNSYVIPLSFSVFNEKGGIAIVIAIQNESPVLLQGTWTVTR